MGPSFLAEIKFPWWILSFFSCALASTVELPLPWWSSIDGKRKSKPVYITPLSSDRVRELNQEGLKLALWLMVWLTTGWTEDSLYKAMQDTQMADGLGRTCVDLDHHAFVRPHIMFAVFVVLLCASS